MEKASKLAKFVKIGINHLGGHNVIQLKKKQKSLNFK